jgi:hypothetical protein
MVITAVEVVEQQVMQQMVALEQELSLIPRPQVQVAQVVEAVVEVEHPAVREQVEGV